MYSLYIDTHIDKIVYVLFKDGLELSKVINNSTGRHSKYAIPLLDEFLKNNNIDINEIEEIIVVNGPGSFTGVRIGVTIAKTIAYSLNIPIKTITTLETMALMLDKDEETLVSFNDRNGYYVGVFDSKLNKKQEYFYLNNSEYNIYKENKNIFENIEVLNYQIIYDYLKDKESLNPHLVNPIYIKKIEALK